MSLGAQDLVRRLGLVPHPEGGWFRETYRSQGRIPHTALPDAYDGERNFSTAIYYLLEEGARSRLHRLGSDELWHFYLGGPLTLVHLFDDGRVEKITLSPDLAAGHAVQALTPAGCWFGAYLEPGAPFALMGCTVAPGFSFADFEVARRAELLSRFPAAAAEIERLTD